MASEPQNAGPQPFIIRPPASFVEDRPDLIRKGHELARSYAAGRIVTDAELMSVGRALWQALDIADEFALAQERAKGAIMPVVLESDVGAIQQLPWETLFHPEYEFLGKSEGFTFSRSIGAGSGERSPLEPGPLRVLLFTSLPDDIDAETSRLKVEEEQARVQEALLPWIKEGYVELKMPDDGRLSTLETFLQDLRPHLVYVSGHGKFNRSPIRDEKSQAAFLFESETGASDLVPEERIADVFAGKNVSCLVLSACESAMGEAVSQASSEELMRGLAWTLSRYGIPQVIGMRESILDRAGILFARAFIDALARRERVDFALQAGRRAITTPLKEHPLYADDTSGFAELSLGQWCLPLLISGDPARPLIDWEFTPRPPEVKQSISETLSSIALPSHFLGRRSELRLIKNRMATGPLRRLLISGPGGQGKTALGGKLARDLQNQGYQILALSARPDSQTELFFNTAYELLNKYNRKIYAERTNESEGEVDRADVLLDLLLLEHERVVLFIDNLETYQDPKTQKLTDERLNDWIGAGVKYSKNERGLVLLLTSRRLMPDWPQENHLSLTHASYGDFLQMAQNTNLPLVYFRERDRLRRVYKTLHGNGRGLLFFAGAIQDISSEEEEDFLRALERATEETQIDMAIEQIVEHLGPEERRLLEILPAYHTPVPFRGIEKLGEGLFESTKLVKMLLERLVAVSLVEPGNYYRRRVIDYQLSPLVVEWLRAWGVPEPAREIFKKAAKYLVDFFQNERKELNQAIVAHQALRTAGEAEEANRFALKWVLRTLELQGMYRTLLEGWLPEICESENLEIRVQGLNQAGKQYINLGDYNAASTPLKVALKIQHEFDYKLGEGNTLTNLGTIAYQCGDYEQALSCWKTALELFRVINDQSGESDSLNNISQVYYYYGDYEQALSYLKSALELQRLIEDKAGEEGAILSNISQIHKIRGEFERARSHLESALKIFRKNGDKPGEGTTLLNLGSLLRECDDNEQALLFLESALKIMYEIDDLNGLCPALYNVGCIYWLREERYEARVAWVKSYRLAKGMNLTQALEALKELAEELDEPGGLDYWEELSQQMPANLE